MKTYGPLQVYRSMLRFCTDFVAVSTVPLAYWSWDATDDLAELPSSNLFGLSGWSYRDDHAQLTVSCGLTLSSYNDLNLMNETSVMDALHQKTGLGDKWPIYDLTTGQPINEMAVSSFEIMPGGKATLRNFRSAAVELLLTRPRGS